MSGIISAPPFNNVFPATKDNSTMQGTVTAIYEVGMYLSFDLFPSSCSSIAQDAWLAQCSSSGWVIFSADACQL